MKKFNKFMENVVMSIMVFILCWVLVSTVDISFHNKTVNPQYANWNFYMVMRELVNNDNV